MRIAHLSDVHILDARVGQKRAGYRFATKLVSLGRVVDPTIRTRRLIRALTIAKESGADHFVISGDLTEVGEDSEFEHFAELLHNAKLDPEAVTLVPGNHDAYTSGGWARAMAGPLASFANASAAATKDDNAACKIVDRGDVAFLPIDTSCFQTIARSSGELTRRCAEAIELRVRDPALRDKAIVLVLHHPPFHTHRLLKWIDGLRGCTEVLDLLARHPRLQLLHGHLHRVLDRILTASVSASSASASSSSKSSWSIRAPKTTSEPTRLFGAPATCDSPDDASPVRLYDVTGGTLRVA